MFRAPLQRRNGFVHCTNKLIDVKLAQRKRHYQFPAKAQFSPLGTDQRRNSWRLP
jgi:hypothetical protein